MSENWLRLRFKVPSDDPRPMAFPPPGPYWISGWTEDASGNDVAILIAFVKKREQVEEFWPDAFEVEESGEQNAPLRFTDRFPKPDWYEVNQ